MTTQPGAARAVLSSIALAQPRFHYSPIVCGAGCVFVSGLVGLDGLSGHLVDGSRAQARQILHNLFAVCKEHDWSIEQILHARVYCSATSDSAEVNRAWDEAFAEAVPPARTFVTVHSLPLGADVEMDFVLVNPRTPNA